MSAGLKAGDRGTTELAGGERVSKDRSRIEVLGALDELNAFLGDARAASGGRIAGTLMAVQQSIFTLSGFIAFAMAEDLGPGMVQPGTALLEERIGEFEAGLPPLRSFTVPGSNPLSAKLHIARTVCRRAERRLVTLDREEGVPPSFLAYLNRLSELLFTLARAAEAEAEKVPRGPLP